MQSALSLRVVRRLVASFALFAILIAAGNSVCLGQGSEHHQRGLAAEAGREFDDAIDHYTLAIAAGDLGAVDLSNVYSDRAGAWANLCENGRAIDDFTRAIEINPSNGIAYSLRGYLRGLSGQAELAAQDHRQALALVDQYEWDDYSSWASQHLADLYRRQGEYELALQTCEEALQRGDYATIYFRRAWIRLDQRDLAGAAADFETYLRKAAEQQVPYDLLWPDEQIAFSRLEELRAKDRQ